MTNLRFNIAIEGDFDESALEEAAALLQEELSQLPNTGEASVVPLSEGRAIGIGEVATIIAVAVPIILNATQAIDAILGTIEKLKKLTAKSPAKAEKSQAVFSQIDLDKILFNVGGRLIPLTQLTQDDIRQLNGEGGAGKPA